MYRVLWLRHGMNTLTHSWIQGVVPNMVMQDLRTHKRQGFRGRWWLETLPSQRNTSFPEGVLAGELLQSPEQDPPSSFYLSIWRCHHLYMLPSVVCHTAIQTREPSPGQSQGQSHVFAQTVNQRSLFGFWVSSLRVMRSWWTHRASEEGKPTSQPCFLRKKVKETCYHVLYQPLKIIILS